jgi:copper chaperone CopZ
MSGTSDAGILKFKTMKNLIIAIAVALLPFIATAQIKEVNLQASGLTCSMCSNAIYKSLSAIAFVKEVDSDVETSTFRITFKEGQDIDIDALQKAVVKAGFSVSQMVLTTNFSGVKINEDSFATIDGHKFYFVGLKEKTLNGEVDLKILDKDFITTKEYKKVKDKLKAPQAARAYNVALAG